MAEQADAQPISVDVDRVVQDLCSTDHGRALWERSQWKVAALQAHERIAELERQKSPTTPREDG
jgi:hypothetical protein